MRLGGEAVEGTVMAASLMLVRDQVPDSNPAKKVAQSHIAAYEKMYASRPATFGANVYDAGLLLQAAVPEAAKKLALARPSSVLPCATRSSKSRSWSARRAGTR